MSERNPESPWNPVIPASPTPKEFELAVVGWLRASAQSLTTSTISHLKHLAGSGGDYEFDAVVELTLFGGARLVTLVECKRWSRPVDRETLLALWAKLQDVGAHKAMVVATCGFQSGAIAYARSRCIATVTFVDGAFRYETRMLSHAVSPQRWVHSAGFVGLWLTGDGASIQSNTIDSARVEPLREWLHATRSGV
jgi:restriction endonuclease Mrr